MNGTGKNERTESIEFIDRTSFKNGSCVSGHLFLHGHRGQTRYSSCLLRGPWPSSSASEVAMPMADGHVCEDEPLDEGLSPWLTNCFMVILNKYLIRATMMACSSTPRYIYIYCTAALSARVSSHGMMTAYLMLISSCDPSTINRFVIKLNAANWLWIGLAIVKFPLSYLRKDNTRRVLLHVLLVRNSPRVFLEQLEVS